MRLSLTLLHIDAVQGVAPEGHIPTTEARLWRYPDWRYMMAIMSGEGPAGTDARWKGAAWLDRFGQRIDAFGALDYDHVVEREESDDLSLGARLVLVRDRAVRNRG